MGGYDEEWLIDYLKKFGKQKKTNLSKDKTRDKPKNRMNKTEVRYEQEVLKVLQHTGEIDWYWFESIKFRLADRTWYTPDFMIVSGGDRNWTAVEIKGFLRDDAAVKFKVAREMYPQIKWEMLRYRKGQWENIKI
jgi:hypothetical protein